MKRNIKHLLTALIASFPFILGAQTITLQPKEMPNWRAYDQKGVNIFEAPKDSSNTASFEGVGVRWGAGFAENLQMLKHENTPLKDAAGVVTNPLYRLDPGFSIAQANLYMDVQLAEGILLNVSTYLSARHHN